MNYQCFLSKTSRAHGSEGLPLTLEEPASESDTLLASITINNWAQRQVDKWCLRQKGGCTSARKSANENQVCHVDQGDYKTTHADDSLLVMGWWY